MDQYPEKVGCCFHAKVCRGIGIFVLSVLTIAAICAVVAVAVTVMAPGSQANKAISTYNGQPITLDEVVSGNFSASLASPVWVTENILVYKSANGSVMKVDLKNGFQQSILLDMDSEPLLENATDWLVSPSTNYVALKFDTDKLYRQSSYAAYNISEIQDGYIVNVHSLGEDRIQLFKWSPHGDDFVFVVRNDIYYQDSPASANVTRVTYDGSEKKMVFNGVTDWLYEGWFRISEELFEDFTALWWSSSGNHLAFASFDDSDVPIHSYPKYGPFQTDSAYDTISKETYSKVGFPIPKVALSFWSKTDKNATRFALPSEITSLKEFYLLSVSWSKEKVFGEEVVFAAWSNRAQNQSFITVCSPKKRHCVVVSRFPEDGNYNSWLEPDYFRFDVSAADRLFAVLPRKSSHGSAYFLHVAMFYTAPENSSDKHWKMQFVTNGNWEVSKVVAYESTRRIVYFIANRPLARHRNLYRLAMNDSADGSADPECLTCHLAAINCTMVNVLFSDDQNHYVLSCLGSGVPKVFLAVAADNSTILTIEDNSDLLDNIASKALPTSIYTSVPLANGLEALVQLLLPPGFDATDTGEVYPMLLYVYAGPGSQRVLDYFDVGFDTYLASTRRWIVAYTDGRGSNSRGSEYRNAVYKRLGTVEIEDQITAARAIAKKFPFIDPGRMAVWGWSYGGFASSHIVAQSGNSVFRCAAAVAPVTNFRFYDAAYTERYMGLLSENAQGYENTDVTRNVSGFGQVRFLLAHGTGDDNVHFRNSAFLIRALEQQNIHFELLVYPDKQHGIGESILHVYSSLENFFGDTHCLGNRTNNDPQVIRKGVTSLSEGSSNPSTLKSKRF